MTVVTLLAVAVPALADGIIIPDPPPIPEPEPIWLTIRYHRVTVTIEDQVATTRVDQVFVNEHEWEAEGTYVFPLPEGATVSNFTMWVDGEPIQAEILEADEARAIYEDIVRRRRDPALLEYVGRDAVQARIFPIPPGGERRIQLEYTQVLPVENGLVRYSYPLNTERFSARPLEECSIRVEIRSPDPIRALYSPTHQDRVFIQREGDYEATVGYEEMDVLPEQDFDLVYTVSPGDVGLNLLTYREPPADGFFLLLVAPTVETEDAEVVPRDVVLVLDTSGSMEGEKIEQAKDALTYVLEHLNSQDRFNIIAFSTGLSRYALDLRPASEAREAIPWVQRLNAVGGTDINRALLEALASLTEGQGLLQSDPQRPAVLIFLTDGLPTEGVTEIEQILSNVRATAPENVRLFPFGVGDDVNTTLLDTLAEQHRGASGYVRPHERIDEEVSAFYAKMRTPVLTDIELDFDDVLVSDTYPDPLPDLFAGTQLILAGRYRGEGPVQITLAGQVGGEQRELVYEGTFRSQGGDRFIPRLWAARKIGYLLTQIRLHGEREEWVDAVIELSTRYGIITPYTSFLIQEDLWTEGGREEAAEEFRALPTAPAQGAPAVEMAEQEARLRGADAANYGMLPVEAARAVRHAHGKTFILREGVWTDTTFDPEMMAPVQVGFGSEAYFDLLASRPEWGEYFAVGSRVLFVAEGTAYEVVSEETGPVEVPPTHTPESSTGPVTSERPIEIEPEDSICPGVGLMMVGALTAAVLWVRLNR
jgi:Ca-activated chloride channel family protein